MSPWVLIRRDFDSIARQLQLVLALAVRAQSQAGGVSKTNAYINVLDAFTAHVLPEIQVPSLGAHRVFLGLASVVLRFLWKTLNGVFGCCSTVVFFFSVCVHWLCRGVLCVVGIVEVRLCRCDACAFLARKLVAGCLYLGVHSMDKPQYLSWLLSRRKQ